MNKKFNETTNYSRYDSESFREAAKPMIEWLKHNANAHTLVTIDQVSAVVHTAEVGEVFPAQD
jgi:hypothetical protein